MDSFNKTVLGIALAILILVLTYAGIVMIYYKKSFYGSFPPTSSICPDYWSYDGTYCHPGTRNTGVYRDKTGTNPPGYNDTNGGFDPYSNGWTSYGDGNQLCNQKKWANANRILWDGVTNSTSCKASV